MINQNYFKQINTEEKAYFLGLIYADGNVTGNIFQILLAEEDAGVLEILKNSIKPSSKLYYYDRKNIKWKNCKRFSIHNKEIVKDLQNWGVYERKTYTSLKIPKINNVLIKHFIRGFLDGDGFISFTESNFIFSAILIANLKFLIFLSNNTISLSLLKHTIPVARGSIFANNFLIFI